MKKIEFIGNWKLYAPDDIGMSKLFVDMFGDEVIYCAESENSGSWFTWNGKNWSRDIFQIRHQKMKEFARYYSLMVNTSQLPEDDKKPWVAAAKKLKQKQNRDTILKDARSEYRHKYADIFDKQPHLFNCQNGTYNFNTGKLQEHRRLDYLTNMSRVVYDEKATAPRYAKYLNDVMEGDKEKIHYLKQIGRYCLSGTNEKEVFFCFYGKKTRNGKSTFMNNLAYLMDETATTLSREVILKKSYNSGGQGPSPETAKLIDKRYVTINEIDDSHVLDIAILKQLTGNDELSTRMLRKDSVKFTPKFKMILSANSLPRMSEDTIFKSGRLHILEFTRHFGVEEADTSLKDALKDEIPGIFNILKDVDVTEFKVPESSKKVLNDYHRRSNKIMTFRRERLVDEPETYIKALDLFEAFKEWCEEASYPNMGKLKFYERLKSLDGVTFHEKQSRKNKQTGKYENTSWVKGVTLKKWAKPNVRLELIEDDEELSDIFG